MEHRARERDEQAEIKTTTCYMCACRCGIRVHLRDGEVRYIDGNPAHPLNQGVICAKGSSGIMKQYSPARLTQPLMRKPGAERGDAQFEPVSWEVAFDVLEKRLAHLRATDPKRFALFTGRDQMQALTGLFAKQFGTPNYAAHGGFCSANMAAGMIYTIGGSFWEFGGPDLDNAKLFFMIGTAEDHHSNPLKIALGKFKRAGGRFIAINPVRTGYAAIADEWIPIRPGTDGALFMALMHELIARDAFDVEFVSRFTNAAELVDQRDGADTFGLFVRDAGAPEVNALYPQNRMWWDTKTNRAVLHHTEGAAPALDGRYTLDDGTPVAPSFTLLREQVAECTPEWAADITGIAADTIRRLAREMETVARDHAIQLPVRWTDSWGKEHESVKGVPIAFHAMRGLAAHSNGFQTIRALAVLMSLLGTIDRPGGFRHKAPYPRAVPPSAKPPNDPAQIKPNTPLATGPLGWPAGPEDLFVHPDGTPARLDKAFSWEYPLAVHGLMHSVITNAWRGDPYPIDTLLIFMANMAWNSSMNTTEVRKMLVDKRDDGEYRIPFLVVCDAFASEMTAFADLILPDTTYLERHDVMSVLDRPISEFDGPVDSVRVPVVPPTGECKPFQEVLIELASRLKFPAFTTADGQRKYRDYPDFVINFQTAPDSGTGFLIGWRGKDGDKAVVGEPNPDQWKRYAENNCVYHHRLPEPLQYMRNCNGPYMQWAVDNGMRKFGVPIVIQLYSDVMQKFRLAAQGRTSGRQPPDHLRERIARYFDPLPFWHRSLESGLTDAGRYPLAAITQRPMAMYHSWDSQNAWLRQIHGENHLFVNPVTAAAQQIDDGAWIYVESPWGKVRCRARYSEAVEPGTVWTWNAIGKAAGAWNLGPQAGESQRGFLLNHVITDELPDAARGGARMSNSDPITGQAGWYDVQVRIYPAEADAATTLPQFAPMPALPGTPRVLQRVQAYFAGTGAFAARLRRAASAGPKSEDR
ncbi:MULTISPECIES: molybdopterin oxidoreductase family protein [Burkholderia]|uniref:Formate dehydrogenase n=1 Tax=Burkholderia contaminans TaxID=488447 RepID=A0A2S5E206_9BURK|nr:MULTISPECIES: molybdopterin oxidoreductase family protein [Burkholderia]EKS9795461.1 molybdopterin-dependent oxidoreductase [Burkholderia cepacia]EKS9801962.1 molybdopterin-dependent oxidoreductase [Burkholderia cepacia]EKS9812066.1 molybdopterin-dependent oxidoreductase [Burkholderia cepacia]EKS9816973.1 molybdopterin-dependent oxidoreductase [Burkholderia cepacia]EKS9825773.1 molybdopterin-dependent oxidoreductase [Burkholderia cepacia]